MTAAATTLYGKLWSSHAVHERTDDGQTLLFIDRQIRITKRALSSFGFLSNSFLAVDRISASNIWL